MGQDEQWVILAEEAAQEKDPEKLMKIIEALTAALDAKRASSTKDNGAAKEQGAA